MSSDPEDFHLIILVHPDNVFRELHHLLDAVYLVLNARSSSDDIRVQVAARKVDVMPVIDLIVAAAHESGLVLYRAGFPGTDRKTYFVR
jgi:hypothetical protein